MKSIKVKEVCIGEGKPKICVPVIGKNIKDIRANAKVAGKSVADIVEWRCDYFEDIFDNSKAVKALMAVVNNIKGKPLILTFRTKQEGGEQTISSTKYIELYRVLIKTEMVDLIDIEVLLDEEIEVLLPFAREHNVKVILSSHNFKLTPKVAVIRSTLTKMRVLGADIAKIAVMPENDFDTLSFMLVIKQCAEACVDIPIIAMSMSKKGVVSRMMGEVFGSSVTFATVSDASAPGQIDANVMAEIVDIIHKETTIKISDINVSLIGFMGSGKTTISQKLSKKLNLDMIDIDNYIVEKEGISINDMFDKYSEDYFRAKETATVKELSERVGKIISCGGGTVLKYQNVEYLKTNGVIILLRATPHTIYERVRYGKERPILNGNMNEEFIEKLMNERKSKYERAADIIIDTDNKSVDCIVDEILEKIVEKYSIVL